MVVAVAQATAPGISSTKSSGSTCVMEAPLDAGSTQPTFAIAETVSLLNLITTGRGADTGFRGGGEGRGGAGLGNYNCKRGAFSRKLPTFSSSL